MVEDNRGTYRQALTVVRDDMKFLNEEAKSWILSKTVEKVWPFPKDGYPEPEFGRS